MWSLKGGLLGADGTRDDPAGLVRWARETTTSGDDVMHDALVLVCLGAGYVVVA